MSALRDAGKVKGNDRIAVMAALGMAAEFLSMKSPQGRFRYVDLDVSRKWKRLHTVWTLRSRPKKICSDGQIRLTCEFIGVNFVPPCGVRERHIFLEPFMCAGCGILFDGSERRCRRTEVELTVTT